MHHPFFRLLLFLCVCIDLEHFDDVFSLARQYPQIYASVGVHPCELKGKDPSVAELLALAEDDNIIAHIHVVHRKGI
jgi:TatD DNase family protein